MSEQKETPYFQPRFRVGTWHYRVHYYVYNKTNPQERISICEYFWTTVLALVVVPFVALFRNLGEHRHAIRLSIFLGLYFGAVFIAAGLFALLLTFGVVSGVIGLVFLGMFFFERIGDRGWTESIGRFFSRFKRVPKAPKVKQPNLMLEYLKARKRKICPFVQWIE